MSAYGAITRKNTDTHLQTTLWRLPSPAPGKPASPFSHLTIHHLTRDTAAKLEGLLEYTHAVFADEVACGTTYPQEQLAGEYTRETFEAYFWAADVFVSLGGTGDASSDKAVVDEGVSRIELSVEGARAGRTWEDCLVGFYYVKPNYPGRSSHICNAGFVVPPPHRQYGYGKTLGQSYLHYGPSLGYKASVFNLVYANNIGSMKIWDSLGFTRAGLIPRAGRMRRADGSEEWVDAVVYYRSFVPEEFWAQPISSS
ncbi:hypothetical protein EVG20_g2587 [Dentipellis fragilis]|uniref:N-acetyltransferase domain-containing protein n=1 Tax=Dentipellis fragilis TaxID=205917 RepID=A0A4Y9Z6C6_9AGAM|nr:hypothetical protein EVG20_g2587 [Dentipellis fragilis]